jgi:DNA-binding MarR family transcriptional regulator
MRQHSDAAPLQRQILRVLAQHPAGLTPGEIASQLGLTAPLSRILKLMEQEGLVRRVTSEVYTVRQE